MGERTSPFDAYTAGEQILLWVPLWATMSRRRDYAGEYRAYYGPKAGKGTPTDLQRLHRRYKASRNKARVIMKKALGVTRLPHGMDVDHRNGHPLDNRPANLRLMQVRRNRGKCAKVKCP